MKMPHRNKAIFLITLMVMQLFIPQNGMALSGGNKAPEFESFQPFGLDNMVDPATGDFSYNIPLMNVGFHGINLFYQAGVTMDQEATMVGLGWNINSGMINRTVRGIPDDFNGDKVLKKMSMKPYTTVGFKPGVGIETFGIDAKGLGLSADFGVYVNNYNGVGFEFSIAPSYSISSLGDGVLTAGIGLSASSDGGATLSPNISFSTEYDQQKNRHEGSGMGIGASINSRGGLKALSLSGNLKLMEKINIIPHSFSGSISFAKPSFVPSIQFPQKSSGFSMDASVGFEAGGVYGKLTGSGYFSRQKVDQKEVKVKAYGLMYHENCGKSDLQDFHRSNDIPQSEDIPALAVPVLDYDVYSVSGPGLSGTMQLNRGDLGLVYDREIKTVSNDGSVGVEFGPSLYTHVGGDIIRNTSKQEVVKWEDNIEINDNLSFKRERADQTGFEKAYFKMSDEANFELSKPNDQFSQIKGLESIRAKLQNAGPLEFSVDGRTRSLSNNSLHSLDNISGKRMQREKRSNNIIYHTFSDASKFGFSNYLFNKANGFFNYLKGFSHVESHHIAEIIVENEDGYRYIYGLPVYNLQHVEETFSIKYDTSNYRVSKNSGLVDFTNLNRSFSNGEGKDEFYSASELPPYVTTHLLTAIVSSDYQDLTGDGPSPDDYGDYVRFDYKQVNNYHWKTPTSENGQQASLSPGFISDPDDDKGHIVYGEREQYRPATIANKTDIAVYEYYDSIPRQDALDEQVYGLKSSNAIKALKSITKFNLNDYKNDPDHSEKLKSVHFEYDYSLCQGVYNGSEGKLTLKKLYVLNGESSKGRFSPYKFFYADNGNVNFNYQPKAVNRFGGYQPRSIGATIDGPVSRDQLSTTEFPYVPQELKDFQDRYASAWNLDSIVLPSGGSIMIDYEADDYAYVQDQRAMQMFRLKGTSSDGIYPSSNGLLFSDTIYLHFDFQDKYIQELIDNGSDPRQVMKDFLLRDIVDNHLFFKVFGVLKPGLLIGDDVEEFVPGWATILDYNIKSTASGLEGVVGLKPVCLKDRKARNCNKLVNPIQKTLMQALRLNLPEYLYGTDVYIADEVNESAVLNTIMAISGLIEQLEQFATGVNKYMRDNGYGAKIDPERSFIRLYNPSRMKLSGTHRVRSILMSDNFASMTGQVHSDAIIGKRYEYTISDGSGMKRRMISSGVAAFEPVVGGEENPLFQPIPYKEELLMAPDNSKYLEEPLMADYYPAPQIIYSKVTTRDLYSPTGKIDDVKVYKNTGYTETYHYTYKDFPIESYRTDKKFGDPYRSPRVLELLKINSKDYYTATQGYFVYNPMMHGKPKASYVYNISGQRISGEEQYYKTKNGKLDFEADALMKLDDEIKINKGRLGITYSLFADTREHWNTFKTEGATGNTDVIPILSIPGPVPTIFPKYADIKKRFRSIVLVKQVRQHGILHKTVSINGPAEITTQHLLWDAETGQPIVSKTFNEFEDPIYQVQIPAHLAYPLIGSTYENSGAKYNGVTCVDGHVNNNSGFVHQVNIGDRLAIRGISYYQEGWVLSKSASEVYLIDRNGIPLNFEDRRIEVIESGKANQSGASIASFVMRENPIQNGKLVIDESRMILDASVTSYKDKWQTYCGIPQKVSSVCQVKPTLINGHFSDGFTGFSSGYTFKTQEQTQSNPPWSGLRPGEFTIGSNAQAGKSDWINCACPSGNCLIIDGNWNGVLPGHIAEANAEEFKPLNIWCQNLEVCPNTHYMLAFQAAHFGIAPALRWKINGQLLSPVFELEEDPCEWNTYTYTWFSGGNENASFCLIDEESSFEGNDFALDNFAIQPIEQYQDWDCSITVSDTINPFLKNILGNWRPEKSYVFQTDRHASDNIRVDGYFTTKSDNYRNTFHNPWKEVGGLLTLDPYRWTWTNENTLVSPWGNAVEARDPLNRFSAELMSYNIQKVTAVAANAKYNEIAYYGAELPVASLIANNAGSSNLFSISFDCLPPSHLNLKDGKRLKYGTYLPNSGEYFMQYKQKQSTIAAFEVSKEAEIECNQSGFEPYTITDCDCLPRFEPTENKDYVLSVWLRHPCLQSEQCQQMPFIEVKIDGNSQIIRDYGPVVEGWRKVEGVFTIPVDAQQGVISISGFSGKIHMDDLRIHPFNATMKTYNYDPKTLRFTYEHDDNNFFTHYGYTDDGTLQRISKQTERGVQTLQESVFGQQKEY